MIGQIILAWLGLAFVLSPITLALFAINPRDDGDDAQDQEE